MWIDFEWKLHIKHEIKQNTKCPHINLKAIRLIFIDFWRHIILSSQHCATNLITLFTKPKICQFKCLFPISCFNQYILWFDIPMKVTRLMQVKQAFYNLCKNLSSFLECKYLALLLSLQIKQIPTITILTYQILKVLIFVSVIKFHYIWRVHIFHTLDFTLKII